MKKFIRIIITALILCIFLSVTSLATSIPRPYPEGDGDQPVVTFSDDFKTVYYNGYEFVQKNLSDFVSNINVDYEFDYYNGDVVVGTSDMMFPEFAEYELTEEQQKIIHDVYIYGDDVILDIELNYRDGTFYSYEVIRTDYLDEYEKLLSAKGDVYTLDFEYPEDNVINIDCDILYENEPKHININSLMAYEEYFEVYVHSEDGKLSYNPGMVIIAGGECYYLDYAESGASLYLDFYEFYYNAAGFEAYPITDEATVDAILEGLELYYEDDYGYLQNDELADSISYFFLIMLFGIIPGFICVISFVYAIIKKKTYRKLLFGVSAFCLAEIIAFVIFLVVSSIK